jgi:hypothetical protein
MMKFVHFASAILVFLVSFDAFAQTQPNHRKEALAKARTIFICTQTDFIKQAEVEQALLEQPEFDQWELEVVDRPEMADLILEVKRVPLTTNFPFRVVDAVSKRIVVAGQVSSLFGSASQRIARQFLKQMKPFRNGGQDAGKAPASPAKPPVPEQRDN